MMDQFSLGLLGTLMRTGLALSAAALIVEFSLRIFRVASPSIRRIAYALVVIQGCLFVRIPVVLPFHASVMPSVTVTDHLTIDAVAITDGIEIDSPVMKRAPARRIPWERLLVTCWGAGIVLLVCRGAWNYLAAVRNLPAAEIAEPEWIAEWEDSQSSVRLRKRIPLHVTKKLGPMLYRLPSGYRLILPASLWKRLCPAQRVAILRHELAHIDRLDIWKSLALRVLALPHWFNPLVWRVARRFDECAEWACDEIVGRAAPESVPDYARALLELGQSDEPALSLSAGADGAGGDGNGLSHRIRRVLVPENWKDSRMKKTATLTAVLVMFFAGVAKFELRADNPPTTPTTDTASTVDGSGLNAVKDENGNITITKITNTITATDSQSPGQAIVDLNYVFNHSVEFRREREALKQEASQAEMIMRKDLEELQELQRHLKAASADQVQSNRLSLELELKRVALQASQKALQKRFMKQETTIHKRIYEKITAEIALYSKEHGIQMVRRVSDTRPTDKKQKQAVGLGQASLQGNLTNLIVAKREDAKPAQGFVSTAGGIISNVTDNKADDSKLIGIGLTADNSTINVTGVDDSKPNQAAGVGLQANSIILYNSDGSKLANAYLTKSGNNIFLTKVHDSKPKPDPAVEVVDGAGIGIDITSNLAQLDAQLEPDNSPAKVESMLKQEFLYVDRGEARDITEEILKRLNDKAAKNEQKPKSE